jgi:hypothetical protein
MSTRGLVGFRIDDTLKMAYNHSDSYPGYLGERVLEWLWTADLATVREQARALRVVQDGETPAAEDVERLSEWTDTGVASGELDNWYVLLRKTQGRPAEILRAGVTEDGTRYGGIEWSYLVDLDANVFAVYEGEVAGEPVDAWPLDDLPTAVALLQLDVDADA